MVSLDNQSLDLQPSQLQNDSYYHHDQVQSQHQAVGRSIPDPLGPAIQRSCVNGSAFEKRTGLPIKFQPENCATGGAPASSLAILCSAVLESHIPAVSTAENCCLDIFNISENERISASTAKTRAIQFCSFKDFYFFFFFFFFSLGRAISIGDIINE